MLWVIKCVNEPVIATGCRNDAWHVINLFMNIERRKRPVNIIHTMVGMNPSDDVYVGNTKYRQQYVCLWYYYNSWLLLYTEHVGKCPNCPICPMILVSTASLRCSHMRRHIWEATTHITYYTGYIYVLRVPAIPRKWSVGDSESCVCAWSNNYFIISKMFLFACRAFATFPRWFHLY